MTSKLSILAFSVAALATSVAFASNAHAGTCPADQTRADARPTGETMGKAVTDDELAAVMLGKEIKGLDGRRLRLRRLVVQPGGMVPWHNHTDRPALIMTVSGSITEYRSDCAVAIEHPTGDVSREEGGISHWWRNNGKVAAVLIAADIKNDGAPPADDHM
jgi:quercetin dioxygenase-like cupin family protein